MPQLPQYLTILLGVSTLGISILYLREYFLRKKAFKLQQQASVDVKQKSIELLNAAQRVETDVLAEGKYATDKFVLEFKTQLENMLKNSQGQITLSQDELIRFMKDLQIRSTEFEEASKNATEQRINQLFERLETRLSDFLTKTATSTSASIELEIKAARELIETYKTQQLKLIDENIVAMIEQTINLVLGKKLSLKDQIDLVYEALEKAKIEKFIV